MNRKQLKVGTDYWHQEGKYAAPVRVRVLTLARLVPVSRAKGGRISKRPIQVGARTVHAYAMPAPYGYPYPVDSVLVAPVTAGRVNLAHAHLARVASLAGEWDTVKAERAAQTRDQQQATATRLAEQRAINTRSAELYARLAELGVPVTHPAVFATNRPELTLTHDVLEALLALVGTAEGVIRQREALTDAADRRMMRIAQGTR